MERDLRGRSNTSRRTRSKAPEGQAALRGLIEALPAEQLEHVFTHSSWAPDRASSYERLEFLGDSVLELAMARALYERYPDFSEGRMAKIRSHVVSRTSCAEVARELGLGEELLRHGRAASREDLERLAGLRVGAAPAPGPLRLCAATNQAPDLVENAPASFNAYCHSESGKLNEY